MTYLAPVRNKKYDTGNSTTTPLGADAVFTGVWTDTLDYSTAIIAVASDQPSAVDGLEIQLSVDGVNPVPHHHSFAPAVHGTHGHHYTSTLDCDYYRIVYTNSSTAQTVFSLTTTLFANPPEEGHVHPLEFVLEPDHQASVNRSVLAAKDPSGAYANIGRTAGGNLKVSFEEMESDVSEQLNLYPAGTGANGAVTLTSAATAYAVPASAPTGSYRITLENKSDTAISIGYQNTNANGITLDPGERMEDDLGSGQQLYAYCASAGKSITYTIKLVS